MEYGVIGIVVFLAFCGGLFLMYRNKGKVDSTIADAHAKLDQAVTDAQAKVDQVKQTVEDIKAKL